MSDIAILKTETGLSLPQGIAALRESALCQCALLGSCESEKEQATLVFAQQELKSILNSLEKAREAAKRPLIEAGRALDAFVRKECEELNSEGMRLAKLAGNFQERERIKAAAAKAAADKEASELERLKHQMLQQSKTIEESDAIQEDFSRRTAAAQEAAQMAQPAQARGQVVREDWKIEVLGDGYTLCKFHPHCVVITAKLGEIKTLLNQGVTVQGVRAEKIISSGVRATKAIEV